MRNLTRLAAHPTPHPTTAAFSTFSGAGGRGRGRGSFPPFPRVPGEPSPSSSADDNDNNSSSNNSNTNEDSFLSTMAAALGRGRGGPHAPAPLPSSPSLPPFSNLISAAVGRGRGGNRTPYTDMSQESQGSKKPIFFRREEDSDKFQFADADEEEEKVSKLASLPRIISPGSAGTGRGKPLKLGVEPMSKQAEVNRHLRPRAPIGAREPGSSSQAKINVEEAVRKAKEALSRGGPGVRGRGRGSGPGRGRGRGRGRGGRDTAEEFELYVGNNADGQKLEKRLGETNMNKLVEGFEDLGLRVLPSPSEEAYLDALHTNNLIEYEPEYLMQFDTNPDIDEKPPMSLDEYMEKMKPFLMAYEGIQSQEEWEDIMKEVHEKLPYMKELMDMYVGPDLVTAKVQNEELERVAKTLPENAPSSVKSFTDRCLLSLQSNPGWGFDKKCQFMDKLVWEVSQHYK